MRRLLVTLALAACAAGPLFADLARTVPPDEKTTQNAVYSRRGSLGPDDYVVTDIPPITASYVMNEVKGGKLRDRAVNTATVNAPTAEFELPLRRTVAGFARGLLLVVTAVCECEITVTGGRAMWGTFSREETMRLGVGTHLFQFVEIGDGSYLVESRQLVAF